MTRCPARNAGHKIPNEHQVARRIGRQIEPIVEDFPQPKPMEVEEVDEAKYEEDLSSEDFVVDWRQLEYQEKARVRLWITVTVLTLWVVWVAVCLVRFFSTGEAWPLATPGILVGPLYRILGFYYQHL